MIEIPLSNRTVTFNELMSQVGKGQILRDCAIHTVDKLSNVRFEGTAIFTNRRLAKEVIEDDRITGVITTPELSSFIMETTKLGVWEYIDPQDLFFTIHEYLVETNFVLEPWKNRISRSALIAPSAVIADYGVIIEDGCVVEENAVVKPFTVIGKGSRIGSLCDIGSDGFEVHSIDGVPKVIKHGGMVIIGENVEILPMVKITRGLSPSRNTEIHDNVKIDSLTHVAHGVIIGRNAVVTGGITIAGNTLIGENAFVGPGAIISNRVSIGENAFVAIGSVVIGNVKKGARVSGNFALDHEANLIKHNYLKKQIKNETIS